MLSAVSALAPLSWRVRTNAKMTPMVMSLYRVRSWAARSRQGREEGVAKLQEEAKLSLAGAQSKMGLYVDRSSGSLPQYFLPQGTAASTHIVKAVNRRFGQLSENEYFCSYRRAAGLSVPECYLDTIGGQPLFVIERFDRMVLPEDDRRAGGGVQRVQRLHQEDFCQVFGLLPERKYEKGGVRYAKKDGMCFTSALRIRCAISRRSCACWW